MRILWLSFVNAARVAEFIPGTRRLMQQESDTPLPIVAM